MMDVLCRLTLFIALSVSLSLCKESADNGVTKTPTIYFLHVNSEIKYRFSKTVITSKVVNPSSEASSEALFDVTLADEAFLSAFKLIINGTEYNGEVKEKEQAKKEYDVAKSRGQSAGHIVSKPRDSNKFQIQVNVAATEKVTFELTYQELLRRRIGNYEQIIFINPRQIVNDFRVDVSIEEYRNITTVNVPPLRNDILTENREGENRDADIVRLSETEVRVSYSLTASQQRALSEQGVSGQFVVQYDIEREKDSGEVLVMDGYFVHFLAPEGLDPMPMDIVFVLDRSGSMSGNKMKQLHESMLKILDEISEQDRFMLISFDNQLNFWRNELVQATSSAIADARRFITSISARGSTDINSAMTEGLKVLASERNNSRAPILVFLTDGQPTSGVTNTVKILENIKLFNEVQIPIFSLAFGKGADYDFTKKVAAQNNGLGKRIYEDSDAALQIAGFYQEISTVLMRNISFKYVDGSLNKTTLTRNNFNTYFKGSELIVAGQIQDMERLQDGVQVFAKGYENVDIGLKRPWICVLPPPITLPPVPAIHSEPSKSVKPTMMENLWAYLTIKQLLRKKDGIDDKEEIENINKKILAMSLKYQFVTPLTSMVVTLPDNSKAGLSSDTVEKPIAADSMGVFFANKQKMNINSNTFAYQGMHAYGMPQLFHSGHASIPFMKRIGMSLLPKKKSRGKVRRKSRRKSSKKPKSPNIQGTRQHLPAFFVNVSSVNMCFDLPLIESKRYSIINMVQQKNGCSVSAEPLGLQTWTPKITIPSLRVNKFRGSKLQETVVISSNQTVPQVDCLADGIRLGILSDQGVRVTADISGRQRKQYTGILSRFVNMKCKVVRRTPRNGKQVVKIKCRQRNKPTLKLKAIERTASSGESCLFLNKKMTNLLNLIPSNYEIIP